MTEPWATAHVDAELDWSNIDTELVTRLTRSAEIATKAVQRQFDKLETSSASTFKRIGREFEQSMKKVVTAAKVTVIAVNRELSKIDGKRVAVNIDVDDAALTALKTRLDALVDRVVSVRVDIDTGALATLGTELGALTDRTVTVKIDVDSASAMADLANARLDMQAFLSVNPLNIGIDINSAGASAALAALLAALQVQANANPIDIPVDVNRRGGLGNAGQSAIRRMASAFSGLGSTALSVGGTLARFSGIAGALTVAVGGSLPAIASLASALGSLAAAAGVAAGGAGIAGLTTAVMAFASVKVGISGVGDAFKAMGKAASGGGSAATDNTKAVERAERSLTKAVKAERDAQKDVGRARDDARKKLRDLDLQMRGAALSEADAELSLKEARLELQTGEFDTSLERERAVLRVQEAEQRLAETRRDNSDLANDAADTRSKGVEGSDEVVDAQERLKDATEATKDAQDALNEARERLSSGGGGSDPYAEAMSKLSDNARAFVTAIQGVSDAWDTMKKGVQDRLFDGLAEQVQPLADLYIPRLGTAMERVAGGFNTGALNVADFMQSATGLSVMDTLLDTSSGMAKQLGVSIGNIIPGLTAIGAGAGQAFEPLTRGWGSATQRLSDYLVKMQQTGQMQQFFTDAIANMKEGWAALSSVLTPLGGIIGGIFNAAKTAGGDNPLAGWAASLTRVSEWVNGEGQTALVGFFQSMQAAMGAVIPVLLEIAKVIGTTVAPMIADLIVQIAPIAQALVQMLGQGLAMLAPAMGPLVDLFASIAAAVAPLIPIIAQILVQFVQLAGPILGALAQSLSPILQALGGALIQVLQALMPAVEPIAQVFEALSGPLTQVAQILGNVLSTAITALMPVVTTIAQVFAQLLEAVAPILPVLGDALIQILTTLAPLIQQQAQTWATLITALIPLLPPLIQIVQALLPPLIQIMTALLPAIANITAAFVDIVAAIAPLLVAFADIIAWLAQIVGFFVGFAADIIRIVTDWATAVTGWFVGMFTDILGKVTQWVADVVGWFTDLGRKILGKITEIKDWVTSKFDLILDYFRKVPAATRQLADRIFSPFKSIAKAMFNGIADLWNNTVGKLSITIPDIPGLPGRGKSFSMPKLDKMATGGHVRGAGTGTSDSIIARLSDGEFVVREKIARRVRPFLEALNAGALSSVLPGFAAGGSVGRTTYGLNPGTNIAYGSGAGFPPWVYEVEKKFGLQASTYPGHQESSGKNKGIDWSGPVDKMQAFAEWCAANKSDMEQVIWMNPNTGQTIGVFDGQMVGPGTSQPGYYRDDWGGHTDHVHTRQSYAFSAFDKNAKKEPTATGNNTAALTTAGGGGGGASSTPIGSGIDSTSSGGSPSWGNSGGGSKYNSADEADAAGVVPVWVENWPSLMGGGGTTPAATTAPTTAPLTTTTPAKATTGGKMTAPAGGGGLGKLTSSSSKDEVATAIYWEAIKRGYTHDEAVALISTGLQESGLDPTAQGGGGAWHGIFQQDTSYPGRDDPNTNITAFLDRLDAKRKDSGASKDIWKNIFWLQQAPGITTADNAFAGGRQAYLPEIQSRKDEAKQLADAARSKGTAAKPPAGTKSDPVKVEVTNPDSKPPLATTSTDDPADGPVLKVGDQKAQTVDGKKLMNSADTDTDPNTSSSRLSPSKSDVDATNAKNDEKNNTKTGGKKKTSGKDADEDDVLTVPSSWTGMVGDLLMKPLGTSIDAWINGHDRKVLVTDSDDDKGDDDKGDDGGKKTSDTKKLTERKKRLTAGDDTTSTDGSKTEQKEKVVSNALLGQHINSASGDKSIGSRVASVGTSAIVGQMTPFMDLFGIQDSPVWLQAINRYQQDNPRNKDSDGIKKKDLQDLAKDISTGDIYLVIDGVTKKVDDGGKARKQRREMRRHVRV